MAKPYIHAVEVTPAAIDMQGHANNVEYVRWMQDAAIAAADVLDPGAELMREAGATWVVRCHHVEYARPAFAGDRLVIRTWLDDVRAASCVRHYEFTRDGDDPAAILVRGRTEWAFVDAVTGRPKRLPADVRERLGVSENTSGPVR
jgi:acyl-CoA thioester hydrolase